VLVLIVMVAPAMVATLVRVRLVAVAPLSVMLDPRPS